MRRRTGRGFVTRVLEVLGLRRRPPRYGDWVDGDEPDCGVREPRRPRPSASGGAVTLELPRER
jgi:hypothetical protein